MEPQKDKAPESKPDQKSETAAKSEDEQKADYGLSLQIYGEEKMSQFSFKEACDYMIAAADCYLNIAKTSKKPELVKHVKEKLPPLLNRIEKCKYHMTSQYRHKEAAGYSIPTGPTFVDEVKSCIVNAMTPNKAVPSKPAAKAPAGVAPKGATSKEIAKSKYTGELRSTIEQTILEKASMVKWEDLIGLDDVKKKMMETIVLPIKNPELFTGLLSPSKGILLFGPPGNGKTMVAKAVASQCGEDVTFFNMSAGTLTSRYYGDSEKLVQALFAIAAEKQPSVIFIDELDSILGARSAEEHEASRRLKTEFLVQFDGVGTRQEDRVVIIGATNRPFDLDEAVLRRFTARIFLPLPSVEARAQMIKNKVKLVKNELTEGEIQDVAKKTDGYSFADLAAVCQEAAMEPIRELDYTQLATLKKENVPPLCAKHFDKALVKVPKSVSKKSIMEYERWNNENKK